MPIGLEAHQEELSSPLKALIYNTVRDEVRKLSAIITNELGNSQRHFYDLIKQKIDIELEKIEQYCLDEKLQPNFKSLNEI